MENAEKQLESHASSFTRSVLHDYPNQIVRVIFVHEAHLGGQNQMSK